MTRLGWLELRGNKIVDISALSGTNLTLLEIQHNEIVDISVLSGQTFLAWLRLDGNKITDITALRGLTSLAYVEFRYNSDLANIQPLLDNTGIGVGDQVGLQDTAVSCADVGRLRQKGATVYSDCS